ncbi:PREDICTED: influenza virus NS1A-binding protein-like isoform X2 [Priapulus caudatus]|nr:PREDICTED: influenza virus NS1A-binding protein-like isoform X2 [Priapulus caudatus]XP_014667366.1 PREDICTED: influenza virus NS1A-binding protein-like isoform X2 [Priapulus caudatus]XP_014667368.1 PREDICTED: influenza virus NS1A-binding protein-like isoform X2 [Priapulus caudatus]XP_014667369.1 PREDICTED: influenza virus NS1A-binding protein-like isoform X2 [Priapulus caudatus]
MLGDKQEEVEPLDSAVMGKEVFRWEEASILGKTMSSLNTLRKNKQFCDVILEVGTHELHAHRAVLACCSRYFFDLFDDDDKEKVYDKHYMLQNFNYPAFEKLVNYAYTARLEVPAEDVKSVYKVARKLKMKPAAAALSSFLASHIDPENCIGTRSTANRHSDISLVEKTDEFIQKNMLKVAVDKEFLGLPRVQIEVVQKGDDDNSIGLDQHPLLCEMTLSWVRSRIEGDNTDVDSLTEKVHMLHVNEEGSLDDCVNTEDVGLNQSEIVQEYKKKSKKQTKMKSITPAKAYSRIRHHSNGPVSLNRKSTKSEDEDDHEWKVIASMQTADHVCVALFCVNGLLVRVTLHEQSTPLGLSPPRSRANSLSNDHSR